MLRSSTLLVTALLSLTAACAAPSAYAQAEPEWRFGVSGVAGWHAMDTGGGFDDVGVEPRESVLFGWRFQYRFHERWGVEGAWSGSIAEAGVMNGAEKADMDPMYFDGNIVFYVPLQGTIKPFLTVGAGFSTLDLDRDGVGDSEDNFAFNFGGGAFLPLWRSLLLRLEVKDYVHQVSGLTEDSAEVLGIAEDFENTFNDVGALIGATWTF